MDFRSIKTHSAIQGSGADATTTSDPISIGRAKAISLQLIAESITNGSATVSLQVSQDGYNFSTYNLMVDNVTGTADYAVIRVGSKNRTANGNDILIMDPVPSYQYVRTRLVYSTDGSYTVYLGIVN